MAWGAMAMSAEAAIKPEFSATETTQLDFELVYAQHFDFVWRNLRRLGVPESNLRDAAQEVFLVIYRRLGEFEPRGTLRSWIYSILRRIALAQKRLYQHDDADGFDLRRQEVAEVSADPETEAARGEALNLLINLLNGLDEDKRDVLVIVDLEGMTVPEACMALDVNLNTLYSRLRAARQQMREMLAQHEEDWRQR